MVSSFCVLSGVSMGNGTSSAESEGGSGLLAVAGIWLAIALSRLVYAAATGEAFGTEHGIALGAVLLASWTLLVALRDRPARRAATPVRAAWSARPNRLGFAGRQMLSRDH